MTTDQINYILIILNFIVIFILLILAIIFNRK